MLVLGRYPEESIYIGDNVEVKVVRIDRGQVKLGITAPKNISISRGPHIPPKSKRTEAAQ